MGLKMVVGLDSSKYAEQAFQRALELARKTGGSLVVVCGRRPLHARMMIGLEIPIR